MIDSVIIGRALQQMSRLTIPNFGTLLKKADGEIVFSQFLSNDDMVFTSIVMNSYKVDANAAKQMVAEFVTDMEAKINAGGIYLLPELGCFVSDSSGSVKFKKEFVPQQSETEISEQIESDIQKQPVQEVPQRAQVTPQPIVGTPQQQRPLRSQTPFGPWQQQPIPQRSPQSPAQNRPQQTIHRRPPQQQKPQNPARRPDIQMNKKHNGSVKKTDYLLVMAIIVALAVVVLIVYSLLFSPTELGI